MPVPGTGGRVGTLESLATYLLAHMHRLRRDSMADYEQLDTPSVVLRADLQRLFDSLHARLRDYRTQGRKRRHHL